MVLNGVVIDDTFAEAFPMAATRLVITADSPKWARIAAATMTGFATSVIGCGVEAGIERALSGEETPDGRPGVAVLAFAMNEEGLAQQVTTRVGQCVLTSPGSACFAGIEGGRKIALGKALRFFGDGWQIAKRLDDQRFWRVPVMDGEFLCEETTGSAGGIGGGNFLILASSRPACLAAAEAAVAAVAPLAGCILPFPGGVVRSGSKVGSKYPKLFASSNHKFCPTLRAAVPDSALSADDAAVLEIVIDGLDEAAIRNATRAGILAACALGRDGGINRISAGNYGGNLGPFHFHLHEIMA
ncbi:MAG: formylmethanofuran--tetrahydromethanopterin N-formyltransferase [Azospirillum sp.]|nr:formylmethanofuran--tetrahydromethanopterin N-formyltransferase [Azospirillum sp.]